MAMAAKKCLCALLLLAIAIVVDSQRRSRRGSSGWGDGGVLSSKSVSGMGKTENIEARQISVSGMSNQVTTTTCEDLSLSGSNNGVTHRGSVMSSIRVSGSSNGVATAGRTIVISVSGSSNDLKTGKCQQLSSSGSSNGVTITGDCDTVTVSGSSNKLRVRGNVRTLQIGDPRNKGRKDCGSNGGNYGSGGTSDMYNNYGGGYQDFSGASINSGGVIIGGNHGKGSRSRRGRGTSNKYNNYGSGGWRNINNSGTFVGNGMGMFFNRAMWIISNGPRRNTINVDGSIGKIEIIQGCETEDGENVIMAGGSCPGGVLISGSKNQVICKRNIGTVIFLGASSRNVISSPSIAGVVGKAQRISGVAPALGRSATNVVATT